MNFTLFLIKSVTLESVIIKLWTKSVYYRKNPAAILLFQKNGRHPQCVSTSSGRSCGRRRLCSFILDYVFYHLLTDKNSPPRGNLFPPRRAACSFTFGLRGPLSYPSRKLHQPSMEMYFFCSTSLASFFGIDSFRMPFSYLA